MTTVFARTATEPRAAINFHLQRPCFIVSETNKANVPLLSGKHRTTVRETKPVIKTRKYQAASRERERVVDLCCRFTVSP